MLVFRTYEDYENVYRTLRGMGDYKATRYLKSRGFENLSSIYDNVYDEINAIKSEDETDIYKLVESYNRYVSIKDHGSEDKEVVSTTNLPQEIIANKDFVFKVGQRVISLTRDFKFSENIFRSCGNAHEVAYTRDEAGCKRDRRARLIAESTIGITPQDEGTPNVENYFTIIALRKRACVWFKYNTNIQFVGEHKMNSQHPDGTTYNPPFEFGPLTFNEASSCENCKSLRIIARQPTQSNTQSVLDILAAKSRGTTQGIGNNYVVMDCQD